MNASTVAAATSLSPKALQRKLFADTYEICRTLREVLEVTAKTRSSLLSYNRITLSARVIAALNANECPEAVKRWHDYYFNFVWQPLVESSAIPLATDNPTSRPTSDLYEVHTIATRMTLALEHMVYDDLLRQCRT
jgi:hypothetical protein